MPKLDAAMAEKICTGLGRLDEGCTPKWGKMTLPQVRGHLCGVIAYTLGRGDEMPFKGNWKTRQIFRRLILSGLVPIPHNIKLPKRKDGTEVPTPDASLDELREALNSYVDAVRAGQLTERTHPFFGKLTPAEWQRFHAAHFKHHLSQFGAWS